MTGYLWAAFGLIAGLGMTALGDMASEEIRDRLDHLPHAILRLAACRLDPSQRVTIYQDEWLPELTYILKGAEARPITRLITGTQYALGILITAGRISHRLNRQPTEQAMISGASGDVDKPAKYWIDVDVLPRKVTVQGLEDAITFTIRRHRRRPY